MALSQLTPKRPLGFFLFPTLALGLWITQQHVGGTKIPPADAQLVALAERVKALEAAAKIQDDLNAALGDFIKQTMDQLPEILDTVDKKLEDLHERVMVLEHQRLKIASLPARREN
jgi:hypothetical protein